MTKLLKRFYNIEYLASFCFEVLAYDVFNNPDSAEFVRELHHHEFYMSHVIRKTESINESTSDKIFPHSPTYTAMDS